MSYKRIKDKAHLALELDIAWIVRVLFSWHVFNTNSSIITINNWYLLFLSRVLIPF